MRNTVEGILARLVPAANGCLAWPGKKSKDGHGRVGLGGREVYVHRIAYAAVHGAIPEGKEIHHRCLNPACANADHLEALTRREHVFTDRPAIIAKANQTHCKHGHEFTEKNTRRLRNGTRQCYRCHYIQEHKRRRVLVLARRVGV